MDNKTLQQRFQPKQAKVINLDHQANMVRFSPDGKVLAAACYDAVVKRLDATTDQFAPMPAVKGHNGWVQCLAFAADGKIAYSADTWGQLRAWPFADAEAKALWNVQQAHDGWVRSLVLSPDGQTLATCGADKMIRLWSPSDGKKLKEWSGGEDVFSLAFHPEGKSLVSGDFRGMIKHWNLESGKVEREFDAKVMTILDRLQDIGGVRCLAFDKEGKTLAIAGSQVKNGATMQGVPLVLVFDWESGKPAHTIAIGSQSDGYVHEVQIHSDGFIMGVTSGTPGAGKLFFVKPGDAQPFFTTGMANCQSLAVHPEGMRLVVAATNANSNGNGRLLKNNEYPGNFSPLHVWDFPK